MKLILATLLLWLSLLTVGMAQQDADNRYLAIYGQLQAADGLLSAGQLPQALAAYQAAQTQLLAFQRVYPDWDTDIVNYRLSDLANKISALQAQVPAQNSGSTNAAVKSSSPATNAPATTPPPATTPATTTNQSNVEAVWQQQLQSLEDENARLQAKLKEALSMQPAAADADALAKANDQIRELMKENDLLRVSQHAQEPAKPDTELAQLQAQLKESQRTLAEQQARIERLTAQNNSLQLALDNEGKTNADLLTRLHDENLRLQARLDAEQAAVGQAQAQNAAATGQVSAQLAAKNDELAKLKSAVEVATLEKVGLEERIKQMATDLVSTDARFEASISKLQSERDDLAQKLKATAAAAPAPQVTNLGSTAAAAPTKPTEAPPSATTQPAAATNATISATPVTTAPVMNEQTAALKVSTPQMPVAQAPATPAPAVESAVNQPAATMEVTVNSTTANKAPVLNEHTPPPQASTPAMPAAETPETPAPASQAVAGQPAATESPAAQSTPVSAQPTPASSQTAPELLPPGTANLVASAQRHFSNHEFDLAEADYHKILQLDPGNGLVLANLAAIELEENKLGDADQHITAALAKSPNDPYDLAMRGKIEFAREDYDDALRDLNHAAQLEPNNPETQNYLGLTLNHLGRNEDAETALIKAVQLDPNYAPAHNNLAVIYMAENPPLPQLARWHYQKALDAGQPRNPELEKLLAEKGAAVSAVQK